VEGRRISRIWGRITLVIIVISLLANVILTGVNIYLTTQYRQNLINLGFQDSTFNVTSIVLPKADDANLGKPVTYLLSNGTIQETIHYGTMYVSVQVLNSHYGALSISLLDFSPKPSEYLDPDKLNQTTASFADQKESFRQALPPGLSQVNPQLSLKTQVYPNPQRPLQGESVQVLLGTLELKAEFLDFDTQAKTSAVFSANISIILEMPQGLD
jgi:hypothetical protein